MNACHLLTESGGMNSSYDIMNKGGEMHLED